MLLRRLGFAAASWVARGPSEASEADSDRIEPLFAEHPLRIALVSGSHYYARDRSARLVIAAGEEAEEGEPLLDREALVEADARVAELWTRSDAGEGDGAAPVGSPQPPLPSYESARPTGIVRYLEPMVADFLAASAEPPSPPEGDRSR